MFKRNSRLMMGAAALLLVLAAAFLLAGQPAATTTDRISPAEYQSRYVSAGSAHLLLDVRTSDEFNSGHIRGSVNIPVTEIESRLAEIPRDQPIVVYCRSGNRSAQALQILKTAGYTQVTDLGGINAWTAAGFTLE